MKLSICTICGSDIFDYPGRKRKYCSPRCFKIGMSQRMMSNKINVGRKQSKATKLKKSIALKGKRSNEKNPNWKGGRAGYMAVHNWARRHWGTPQKCEVKGCSGKCKKYHWANISGKYKRDRSDWLRACASCHLKYDWSRPEKNKLRELRRQKMLGNNYALKNAGKKTRK